MVTLKDIKRMYPSCTCEQIDSKQLFIVDGVINGAYHKYLISYDRVIGEFKADVWYITTYCYSASTTRQINSFINNTSFPVIRVKGELS